MTSLRVRLLLGIGLPEGSGPDLCRAWRAAKQAWLNQLWASGTATRALRPMAFERAFSWVPRRAEDADRR